MSTERDSGTVASTAKAHRKVDKREQAMEAVRVEIEKDRNIGNDVLKPLAEKIDPSVKKMDLRKFNATIVLQVRRKLDGHRPRSRNRKMEEMQRARIRATLIEFGKTVASADPAELVEAIGNVDLYVTSIMKVARGKRVRRTQPETQETEAT